MARSAIQRIEAAAPTSSEEGNMLQLVAGLLQSANGRRAQSPAQAVTIIDAATMLLGSVRAEISAALSAPAAAIAPAQRKTRVPRGGGRTAKKSRKPRTPKRAAKPRPAAAAPSAPATAAKPAGELVVQAAGFAVDLTEGQETIGADKGVLDVTKKQARLLAALARATPNPVDRSFLIGKVWGASPPTFADQMLSSLCGELRAPLATIGLETKITKGVGISLALAA